MGNGSPGTIASEIYVNVIYFVAGQSMRSIVFPSPSHIKDLNIEQNYFFLYLDSHAITHWLCHIMLQ